MEVANILRYMQTQKKNTARAKYWFPTSNI